MRLYVGNLPYQATESDVESFFAESGVAVDNVDLMRDKFSGEARGFGFVEIQDDSAADIAIQTCNGKDMMGRRVVVNEARPKAAAAAVGFGGDFGGGRDSGGGRDRRGGPSGKRGRDKRSPRW
jgi:RNA recognition motif-containing protein